jgi:hypothetical protein
MNLKDIIAISGEPGLFKFIAQGKNAIIIEHLETKKRSSAYSSAKVSSLEDISIFTETEDMPLGKVFDLIFEKEKGGKAIDSKSEADKLRTYFEEVLPEYARERVYPSDIKKVVQWYNTLHSLDLLLKDEPEKASTEEVKKDETENEPQPDKKQAPAKKKAKPSAKKTDKK